MNNIKNRVHLIGRLGMDPEVKDLESGKKLAKFSVATNDYYYDKKGERVTETQWHNIVAWGKMAELVDKILVKGKEVALEGKLNSRSYEDGNGNKRYVTEIIANEFVLLGKKSD
jgi:single-strand DNA-binding protein